MQQKGTAAIVTRRDQRKSPSALPGGTCSIVHCRGFFLRPPAQKLRAVAESALREIVVLDLADQLRPDRLPLPAFLRRPAAGPPGTRTSNGFSPRQRSEFFVSLRAVVLLDRRRMANMDQPSFVVVQPEQERTDDFRSLRRNEIRRRRNPRSSDALP